MATTIEDKSEFDIWCQDAENALKVVKERRAAIQERVPQIAAVLNNLTNDVRKWHSTMTALYDEHGIKANEICIAKDSEDKLLGAQLRGYEQVHSNNDLEMREYAVELQHQTESITNLKQRHAACLKENNEMKEEKSKHLEKSRTRDAQMQQLKRRNKRTEAKIQKEYLSYKKAFGLHIKAIDGTTLRFTFTKIDKNNPNAECVVDVEDMEGSYRARGCDPMLSKYQEMAHRLHQQNGEEGLRTFLHEARVEFEQLLSHSS